MANQQQLNLSYFKPEFLGKPEEDMEAYLLRTNDWMETHNFPDDAEFLLRQPTAIQIRLQLTTSTSTLMWVNPIICRKNGKQ